MVCVSNQGGEPRDPFSSENVDRYGETLDALSALCAIPESDESVRIEIQRQGASLLTLLKAERSVPLQLIAHAFERALMSQNDASLVTYIQLIKRVIDPGNVHLDHLLNGVTYVNADLKKQSAAAHKTFRVIQGGVERVMDGFFQPEINKMPPCDCQLRVLLTKLDDSVFVEVEEYLQQFEQALTLPERRQAFNNLVESIASVLQRLIDDSGSPKRFEIISFIIQHPQIAEMGEEMRKVHSRAQEIFREHV
jgi:hypothetical protein